jgi:hypothetical protein
MILPTKRLLLFIVCVIIRSALVVAAALTPVEYLYIIGIFFVMAAIVFAYKFLTFKDGDIGMAGGNVWWNCNRLMHVGMYLAFAVLAFCKVRLAYSVLIVDLVIGVALFVRHYVGNT